MKNWKLIYRQFFQLLPKSSLSLFPFFSALRKNPPQWKSDSKAAISVMLLALPQGIAYATIADIPIIYGLICSAIACCIAPLFSSSNYTILGPSNATAFTLFSFFATLGFSTAEKISLLPLFTILVGSFCIIGSLLKISEVLQYISRSVLTGYLTGAAILIITNQVKYILHLEDYISGATFFHIIQSIIKALPALDIYSLLLGLLTLITFLIWKKKRPQDPHFIVILILFTSAISFINTFWQTPLIQIATFSEFSIQGLTQSQSSTKPLLENIILLSSGAFAVAFLACMENTLSAKSIASRTNEKPDLNQDTLALGITNFFCSFFSGMPASGSLTRSSLNYYSQAKSRFSSLLCGILCFSFIYLFIQIPLLITSIPKACIAGLVIGVALGLFQKQSFKICLKSTTEDATTLLCTLLATLFMPIHTAIFIGVITSVLLFLRKAAKPQLVEYTIGEEGNFHEIEEPSKRHHPEISIIHIEGNLFFGGAELFYQQMSRLIYDQSLKIIILRMRNTLCLDATSISTLQELIILARENKKQVLITGATSTIYRILKRSGLLQILQEDCPKNESNLFLYNSLDPNKCAKEALQRSQKILGKKEADIRIFYTETKEEKINDPNKKN